MKTMKYGLIGATLLCLSCEHKQLCYHHEEHALRYYVKIQADYRRDWHEFNSVDYDWKNHWPSHFIDYESIRPLVPKGLRIISYPAKGGQQINNRPAFGGEVYLNKDYNDMLLYNNDTERIVFEGLNSYATARATTYYRYRSTYQGRVSTKEQEETTVNPPDMLYIASMKDYYVKKTIDAIILPVMLQPMVFTYKVRYEFAEGLEYVSLARGALSGMAESVLLTTGKTSDEFVTLLYDCDKTDFGARAMVKSFGVPNYPADNYVNRNDHTYMLNLEVRLKNGKMKNFDFDVTNQVSAQPHGGVIVVKDIVIPKSDGESGSVGGGFDVGVGDWGDYEDVI